MRYTSPVDQKTIRTFAFNKFIGDNKIMCERSRAHRLRGSASTSITCSVRVWFDRAKIRFGVGVKRNANDGNIGRTMMCIYWSTRTTAGHWSTVFLRNRLPTTGKIRDERRNSHRRPIPTRLSREKTTCVKHQTHALIPRQAANCYFTTKQKHRVS